MGERKSLNKYIPQDFDPSKLRRAKKPKNQQSRIRTMLGLKVRCNNCGTHIPPDKKLNCRKETVSSKDYLGIPIFRFYFKCPNCTAEFITDTDPKNSDYTVEFGAKRCYESCWSEEEKEAEKDKTKSLEERALELKRQMNTDTKVDEIRLINFKRNEDARLEALKRIKNEKELQEAEDQAITKSIKFVKSNKGLSDGKEFKWVKREAWNDNLKRRKVCREAVPGFETSSIRISVNKRVVAFNKVDNDPTTGLDLLGKNYKSDEDI